MATKQNLLITMEDRFLYSREEDRIACFSNGDPIFYGNIEEAAEDRLANEEILTLEQLPENWQAIIKSKMR